MICEICGNSFWVCEQHLGMTWPHNDCDGPGELCVCTAGMALKTFMEVDMIVHCSKVV